MHSRGCGIPPVLAFSKRTMASSIHRRHTLLVLDDEIPILNAIRRLLRDDYEVLTTTSVDEAFQHLETRPVHLVMSDQRMPEMSGVEFLTFVKECYPDCVRILFTGYTDTQSAIEAINSGKVYCYIPKPWDPEELKLMLSQAAGRYDLAQERGRLMAKLRDANEALEERNRELEIANKKLQELDHLKNVFMEVVSHELNTPISIIQGYAFLLKREMKPRASATTRHAVEGIKSSTLRLENITNKIFKVLHSQTPHVVVRPSHLRIEDLLSRVEEVVSPFLSKRRQTLRIEVDEALSATFDAQMITDALVNLVMNAIKFSPDGRTITLRATSDASSTHIRVIDQGVGIWPRDLPRIFQTFFGTFDSKHHSSGDFEFEKRGIGLGLSIVKKFVQLHGGQVSVVTERGVGSTFTLHLPSHTRRAESLPIISVVQAR